jgi:hypothetical protein
LIEGGAIATVAIKDKEARRFAVPPAAFDKLLRHPSGGRMLGDPNVENFPAGVVDDEKDVERPEQDRLDAEEIAGPNRRGVLPEKSTPALSLPETPSALHR